MRTVASGGDERKKARIVRLEGWPGENDPLTTDTGATGAESRRLPRPEWGFSASIAISGDPASLARGEPAASWPRSNRHPPGTRDRSPASGSSGRGGNAPGPGSDLGVGD